MKRTCVRALAKRAGVVRAAARLTTAVVSLVIALASAGAAQTGGGGRRTVPDMAAAVFDVENFGADAGDDRDDRAAIQSAIEAAEAAGGGTVLVPRAGIYNLVGRASDAQLLLVTRSIKFQCVPGAELLMSVAGANRTHGMRVAPVSTAPSYNVLSQLEIEGCRLVPARGSAPGGYGLFFDTSGARTQIRNALVRGTHVGTPASEFGDYALAMTNPTGAPDTQFTNSFRDLWLYGGIRVDKVGDSLEFDSVRVASNVPDRPSMYVNLVGGATGPNVRGGNMTAGGGIVIASGVNPNFTGGLIVEVGNRSLTNFTATPAVIQVKGGGIVPRVQGAKFEGISIITLIPGVHGMIVDRADTTVVGTNTWNVSTQGGPGLDPVYQLPNARPLRVITTANALGTMWHNVQHLMPGSAPGIDGSRDREFSRVVPAYTNAMFEQEGHFGVTRTIRAREGYDFGADRPKMLAGVGSPEGVAAACPGSTYHRSDGGPGTSFYVKEGAGCTSSGWAAYSRGGGGGSARGESASRAAPVEPPVVASRSDGPVAFVAPTLNPGWVNQGGAFATAGYVKHGGRVELKGTIVCPNAKPGVAWTLPQGFRPVGDRVMHAQSGGLFVYLYIEADGDINVLNCNGSISLDGIVFTPEQ